MLAFKLERSEFEMQVEIKGLTKIYGDEAQAVVALSDLNLTLGENEICIVRGPNGSGKTTLISILSGELKQSAGQIKLANFDGIVPRIAVVNQFDNLIPELTVKQHFEVLDRNENISLISNDLLAMKSTEISRGQAQIIAIALALSADVDLLLADEPTGALGHEESELVYQFIKETATKNNSAVLLVTHDPSAEKIADRVVRLRDGRISEVWTPGSDEKQVVDPNGWLKLPDKVLDGLAPAVEITYSNSGANLTGRIHEANIVEIKKAKRASSFQTVVDVKQLTTKHGSHLVSKDLTFEIKQAEIFAVFGKSGAGKTTLLKTLSNLHHDFLGDIQINSKLAPAYFNLENIFALELNLAELRIPQELISNLALTELTNRPLKTFSGGQKHRALVAIALANPSEFLLLDEPTSALDQEMTDLVLNALLASDKTLLVATHDDRIMEIANNQLRL
jgi:ABC-type multidrug transport system ATPase subunit